MNLKFQKIDDIKHKLVHNESYFLLEAFESPSEDVGFTLSLPKAKVIFVWKEFDKNGTPIGEDKEFTKEDIENEFQIGDRLDGENSYFVLDFKFENDISTETIDGIAKVSTIKELFYK